ncbi:MAG TPA: hypothetical protein VIW24_18060 [Aldersonia sp.]
MNETPAQQLRTRVRTDLRTAMKVRDTAAVAALRSALAGIDNAEAVAPTEMSVAAVSEHVAGAGVGVGSTESARLVLSVDDVQSVLHTLITELSAEAGRYDGYGQADAAQRLRSEAAALSHYVD